MGTIGLAAALWLSISLYSGDEPNPPEKPAEEESPRYVVRSGRPGELIPEEEARYKDIVDRFILHDVGMRRDLQAVREFQQLGHDAIPVLVQGFNKAITMSHSCPAGMINQKMSALIRASHDRQVLAYIRAEVGAGARQTPYAGLVNNLKVMTSVRSAELARLEKKSRPGPSTHPGGRSPGTNPP
ncbi:MAG TPA: hypothetical protein PKC45_12530 [Gemmatales bacterium]|nr:hypothetical protein [Gemmatales bacterium]